MTQEELAEKMFVSRQTVSSWETDRNRPDVDTLISLAAVFETDVNDLIYGSPKSAYQKYQKRYIAAIAISVISLIIIGVISQSCKCCFPSALGSDHSLYNWDP